MAVEDLLLREVKKLTQFLLTLLGKAEGITLENSEETVADIAVKFQNELGISLEHLLDMDDLQFIGFLKHEEFLPNHLETLGDLFSELYFKKTGLENTAQKALTLYKYAQQQSDTYSLELNQKMNRFCKL